MVDLSGGQDGPLEHAFSNSVFIIPGLVVISLTAITNSTKMADLEDNLNNLEEAELNDLLKNGNPEEIRKNVLDMLDDAELTEDMKENLRNMLSGNTPKVLGGSGPWLGLFFALLIFSIILFFGYKLYKSIKDKEVKREEKKKAKQMKKKK